jgi:hypothetical protein
MARDYEFVEKTVNRSYHKTNYTGVPVGLAVLLLRRSRDSKSLNRSQWKDFETTTVCQDFMFGLDHRAEPVIY